MKNNRLSFIMCSLLVIFTLGLTACFDSKGNSTSTQSSGSNSKKIDSSNVSNNKETQKPKEEMKTSSPTVKSSSEIKFVKQEMDNNSTVSFNTTWKSSKNGSYNACIEGKGSEALEEGTGKIIIKDPQKVYSFQIENNSKLSPKYLEWADDKNLLVVIGYSSGSISKGGDLYMLNVDTRDNEILIKMPSKKQQIMSAEKNGDIVNLKVNVYDDDVYNKCHVENWTINSFSTNLNSKMEVKNSNGKVVYTING
ncbi:hypothetical protein CLRAG_22710 [Clostridium ragsdalei P11]|uniref:DUF4652 domain-containing protein n=1 Tax=Clostridium ragsdalei P11 TaxID=1353534 RepID=A0A1A6ASD8_9CLOT|nr:DUF4652 domain-containing protein [Clostridium ragsdalei]OBR92977.1 hypothetical protein CLRAG_22710 [Clostridium ragsdalei P11]